MDKSDEALMLAYQKGDKAAFKALYERYSKRVYGYLHQRIQNQERIDEIFQSIFLKLHKTKALYKENYSFSGWLFTISKSVIIDAARTRRVYDENKFVPLAEELCEAAPDTLQAPTLSLEGLEEAQKEVIQMRYLEDLDFNEMAKRLEISESSVRKRVSRAVIKLRSLVGKFDEK